MTRVVYTVAPAAAPRLFFPSLSHDLAATLADARIAAAGETLAKRGADACRAALRAACAPVIDDARVELLAGLIAYDQCRGDIAHDCFSRAVAADPSATAWLCFGHACVATMRYRDAIAAYRRALRLDQGLYDAHRYLWSAIEGLGELDSALAAYKHALLALDDGATQRATERVRIENTTLCLVDTSNHALAQRALEQSTRGCAFDAVKLVTDRKLHVPEVETVVIDALESTAAYSHFVMKELLRYVETEYVLLIQWDGYVVNPDAWGPHFLLYDYIGARWLDTQLRTRAHHNVGNGGFSLRSRTLLEALQDSRIEATHPEDAMICRVYRDYLEERYGIAFAPEDIADSFSFEHAVPASIPFGFHGVVNIARFIDDPSIRMLGFWDGYGDDA